MNNRQPLNAKQWYRVDGQAIFCVRLTETYQKDGSISIDMEGIKPQDYAAYIKHRQVVSDGRTIADIMGMPMPEMIELHFTSTAKVEAISMDDVLRQEEEEIE